MKKMLVVIMAMIMALSMVACGGADTGKEDTDAVKVIEINLTEELYAFGVDKNQPELLAQVNDFIKEIKDDGTFDAICDKYFSNGEPTAVKSATLDPSKDQLVVATNAAFEPFEYMIGDSYYGIDMEIAQLLANKLGQELVIMNQKDILAIVE